MNILTFSSPDLQHSSTLTDEDILRMIQQIFRLLIARIYGDELDLLKMQDDTVIAEDDVLGRSWPQ